MDWYNLLFNLSMGCIASINGTAEAARHFPAGVTHISMPPAAGVDYAKLNAIAPIVSQSIANGAYPGAVVLAGYKNRIIYRGVFGNRRLEPTIAPMKLDTVFDIASLTKVVATTPAVMQLVQAKKLRLDRPVSFYWHGFAKYGKGAITVKQLMTHTSGLPPDLAPTKPFNQNSDSVYAWRGEDKALQEIANTKLIAEPGSKVIYSDINFIVLAYLVEKISHQRIDRYAQEHIYQPLKMSNTRYLPAKVLLDRIAPTAYINHKLRWGEVNDPTAYAMRGVAGHAGVFSTGPDLAIYANTFLHQGLIPGSKKQYLLKPSIIAAMTIPQTPLTEKDVRGLGWDIDLVLSKHHNLAENFSYGHLGWTGTSLWINPKTQTWVIILTSRTHPRPLYHNRLMADRYAIARLVAQSIR